MSEEIPDDTTADNLRNRISGYFSSIWGSNINVVKVDYDADALETTDADLTVQSIYTVTLRKLISQNSFTSAAIVPISGDATVEIGMQTVTSSTPLSGKFKVVCPDENLNEFSTTDMNYDNWTEGIDFNIQLQIPHLQFKVWVRPSHDYEYKVNGVKFILHFTDYHGDVGECRIESSTDTPIVGDNVQYNTVTVHNYGDNLFWEPVPLEFIYTDAEKPQVLVNVNGIAGVCPDFNCDFMYEEPVGQITEQILDADGVSLTIRGTNLPVDDVTVRLANSQCTTVTAAADEITCVLDVPAAAG